MWHPGTRGSRSPSEGNSVEPSIEAIRCLATLAAREESIESNQRFVEGGKAAVSTVDVEAVVLVRRDPPRVAKATTSAKVRDSPIRKVEFAEVRALLMDVRREEGVEELRREYSTHSSIFAVSMGVEVPRKVEVRSVRMWVLKK